MTRAQRAQLNKVFDLYGLNDKDHVAETNEFVIINRSGILKIKSRMGISVLYDLVFTNGIDIATIKASTTLQEVTTQTFGEVSPKNCDFPHPVNVAEKRSLSRLVLELAGLHDAVFLGGDEFFSNPVARDPKNKPNYRKTSVRAGDEAVKIFVSRAIKIAGGS